MTPRGDGRELAPTPDYRSDLPADVEICSCPEALALRATLDAQSDRIDRARKILAEGRRERPAGGARWQPFCPACGFVTAIDDDGTCAGCGADTCALEQLREHLAARGLCVVSAAEKALLDEAGVPDGG